MTIFSPLAVVLAALLSTDPAPTFSPPLTASGSNRVTQDPQRTYDYSIEEEEWYDVTDWFDGNDYEVEADDSYGSEWGESDDWYYDRSYYDDYGYDGDYSYWSDDEWWGGDDWGY